MYSNLYSVISENEGNYLMQLNPEHEIFAAHFPDQPIFPGACMMQMVQELIGKRLGQEVQFAEVKQVKYMQLLTPAERTVFQVQLAQNEKNWTASILSEDGSVGFTKMKIVIL